MARIRTVKPDFFTSEDIVGLSFPARLLYVALWCEADREGRLVWRPPTFKLRYFPGDKVNIETLAQELVLRDLVVLYGDGLAYIPTFLAHQVINPREKPSSLPIPSTSVDPGLHASARVSDASNPDLHAQIGREGKGRERKGKEGVERSRGSRLLPDWQPSEILKAWASKERPDLNVDTTVRKFVDHWSSVPGGKGLKLDWDATFRNWVRGERPGPNQAAPDYSAVIANLKD